MGSLRDVVVMNVRSCEGLSWRAVVEEAVERRRGRVRGCLLGADAARWIELDADGAVVCPGGLPDHVFELRLFDDVQEWRWIESRPESEASWSAVGDVPPPVDGWHACAPAASEALEPIGWRSLIWGLAIPPLPGEAPLPEGWTWMGSARTGPFPLPAVIEPEGGAVLLVEEYAGVVDADHNVAVVMERWIGLDQAREAPVETTETSDEESARE